MAERITAPAAPLRLILASASSARKIMLTAAGLTFDAVPADIDEAAITALMVSESACVEAADVALALAREKATSVSQAHPDALVIGSDQVLALGQRLISKAASINEARDVLDTLRGRSHELVSAVALARDGELLWQAADHARLTMRRFSDEFLAAYLDRMGDRVLRSAGCYELEGAGVQLFDTTSGDHFTILGMPLLPLLAELRSRGVVLS